MENINTKNKGLTLPDVPEGQLRQVGQLLHLDDGVVERRLQTLGHHVRKDDRHHHGQDVGDLTGQLEADYCSGNSMCDGSRHRCRTWWKAEGWGKALFFHLIPLKREAGITVWSI